MCLCAELTVYYHGSFGKGGWGSLPWEDCYCRKVLSGLTVTFQGHETVYPITKNLQVGPGKVAQWLGLLVALAEPLQASPAGPDSDPVSNQTRQKSQGNTESAHKVDEATEAPAAQPQSTRTRTHLLLKWQEGYFLFDSFVLQIIRSFCNQRKQYVHEPAKHTILIHSDGAMPVSVPGDLCGTQQTTKAKHFCLKLTVVNK